MTEDDRRRAVTSWFGALRDRLCQAFEAIEAEAVLRGLSKGSPARFERRDWQRPGGGGGTMALMRGAVFEKVGVNVSEVWGDLDPRFAAQIPGAESDPRFWAAGISLVAHMANPHVPAAHMNTRMVATTRTWFGGGADITPCVPAEDAVAEFHKAMEGACASMCAGAYDEYRAWCDRYFTLPHRNEKRGDGGIFFDDLSSDDPERDLAFVRAVGEAFLHVFPRIVVHRMSMPFTPADKAAQRAKRARYVEFNLLHDRGTLFGLRTGGNPDAILMSLPPDAGW